MNTNGFNNISYQRRDKYFKNPATFPGYEPAPLDMDKFIPLEVMRKLRDSKKYLDFHKREISDRFPAWLMPDAD